MNNIQKENLRELLLAGINTYNPEWIEQCEGANKVLDALIDSISEFSDECQEEDPKEEALRSMQPKFDHVSWLKNNKNSK